MKNIPLILFIFLYTGCSEPFTAPPDEQEASKRERLVARTVFVAEPYGGPYGVYWTLEGCKEHKSETPPDCWQVPVVECPPVFRRVFIRTGDNSQIPVEVACRPPGLGPYEVR